MLELSEKEIIKCQNIFNQIHSDQEQNTIDYLQLKDCLEKLEIRFEHINVFHKLLSEMENNNQGRFAFGDFLQIYQSQKNKKQTSPEEDTIDAFIAMGGNQDKTGEVIAGKLIDIIKEFQMTIDIEKLIREVDKDNSGFIDYDEFKSMLQNNEQNIDDQKFKKLFFS